jgi:hypothetical protein
VRRWCPGSWARAAQQRGPAAAGGQGIHPRGGLPSAAVTVNACDASGTPTPGLRVAAGQSNRRTLNQWWKVRMLAGWAHIRVLKPALSSTNAHSRCNQQLDSVRTFSPIPGSAPTSGPPWDPTGVYTTEWAAAESGSGRLPAGMARRAGWWSGGCGPSPHGPGPRQPRRRRARPPHRGRQPGGRSDAGPRHQADHSPSRPHPASGDRRPGATSRPRSTTSLAPSGSSGSRSPQAACSPDASSWFTRIVARQT